MAWIKMISVREAQGKLKELYQRLSPRGEEVDNILRIHSLNPASLSGHLEFYKILMYGKSGLSRPQREMIAVVVSAANRCHY